MKTLALLLLGCLAAVVVTEDDFFPNSDSRAPYERTSIGKVVDKISYKFLKEAVSGDANQNFISSPLGVLILLSLYSEGVGGQGRLKGELLGFISNYNNTEVPKSYTELSERLSSIDSSSFVIANKIYLADGAQLQETFLTRASGYHSEVGNIDFTKKNVAADTINKWVSDKTKGTIKEAVTEDTLTSDMVAALLNVIYFQLIELPYKERNFRMVVVLPNEMDGLSSVINNVGNFGLLEEVRSLRPSTLRVNLQLPKFKIDTFLDLKNVLDKLRLKSLFTHSATNILKDTNVTVSKVIQKAFVNVDEKGATAGAFTGIFLVPMTLDSSPPEDIEFHVDRPFLFAIYYEEIPLFLGTYVK